MFKNLLLRNHKEGEADIKGKFSKKKSKFFFSEIVRRMKLKLGILAKDIALYKSYIFYSGRIRTLVAMATYSSQWEKLKFAFFSVSMKIFGIFFYRNVY